MKPLKDRYEDLYPFQKDGVKFLTSRRSALLADEVGVGKTPQALLAAQHVGARRVLVLCPAAIKYNWRREAINWGYDPQDIVIVDKKNLNRVQDKGLFIINYDLCHRPEYLRPLTRKNYDVLICDESHYLKNHKALRTSAVYGPKGYADISIHRWMLTGTPVLNRPVELHSMLRTLAPNLLGNFANYIAYTIRYCKGHSGNWGWDATGATNIDELAGRLEGFMLRRERDALTDLPSCVINKIYLEKTKKVEKLIFKQTAGETDEEGISIRQKIGLSKIPASVEHIIDLLDAEEKVVVFAHHRAVIAELQKELKAFDPVVIQGDVSLKDRDAHIQTFRTDPNCRVFIGQIDATGTGVDGLQDASRHAVFVELSYVPGINKQAIGRIHRNGQKHKVVVDFLLLEDSVDDNVLDKNILKAETIQSLMKDENFSFNFNEKQGEPKMELTEKEFKAMVAKVLREIAETLVATPAPVTKKKKTVEPEPMATVEAEVTPAAVAEAEFNYEQAIMAMPKRVQEKFGAESQKVNETLRSIQTKFQAICPGKTHVFQITDPAEQKKVVKELTAYLKSLGIL